MAFLSLLCQASHVPIFMPLLSLAGLENQIMEWKIITFKINKNEGINTLPHLFYPPDNNIDSFSFFIDHVV